MTRNDSTSLLTGVREGNRRLFLQSMGVAGLGLAAGTTAADADDATDDESEGAADQDDEGRTEIDSPTVIDEPGEYELVADLSPDQLDQPACIVIDADDVSLYGNDHTIDVTETSGENWRHPSGIRIHSGGPYSEVDWRVTVADVEVRGGAVGIESIYNFNQDLSISNVAAIDNGYGFRFDMTGGTVENCIIQDNDVGVRLDGDTHIYGEDSVITLRDSTIRWNDAIGFDVGEFARADIETSRIVDNGIGVKISAAAGEMEGAATLQECHVCGNEHYGVDAGATHGPGADAGPGEEPGPWVAEADATDCYWGAANGPGSFGDPEEPFTDPETGRAADGDGDAISQSLEPGVSNVRFDPFREAPIDGVGADR